MAKQCENNGVSPLTCDRGKGHTSVTKRRIGELFEGLTP